MAFVRIMTVVDFRARTIMPGADVDLLELNEPDFLQTQLDDWTEEMFARLRKRYNTALMAADPPRTIMRWLTKIVTREAYAKRGYNPSNADEKETIEGAAERAETELKEAADSKEGLFELPLLGTEPADGAISRGGPLGYSETSPYVWADQQIVDGRNQDRNGRGN